MTAPDTSLTGASAQERESDKAEVVVTEALRQFIYETTSLSPEEDDGSHWCKISKACLERGRAALSTILAARGAAVPDAGAGVTEQARADALDKAEGYLLGLLPDLDAMGKPATYLERFVVGAFGRLRAALSAIPAAPAQAESEAYRAGMMRAAEIVLSLRPGNDPEESYTDAALIEADEAIRAEAASAVPSDPRGDGWQTIDTAPKDGTRIFVGRDMGDPWGWITGTSYWEDVHGVSGWISRGIVGPSESLGLGSPTHWQPLPAPPAPGAKP